MSPHVILNLINRVKKSLASYALLASPAFSGTPTAPTASVGTSTTQLATTAFVAAAIAAPRKNLLINGCFRISQRAPATNADDTYSHDRWYVLTQTGTIAVTNITNVEDGTPYMARLTQSQASAQRMGYAQIIEGVNCKHLRGQAVSLKFRTRLSASANLRVAILEWTGTENGVTSDVVLDWTSGTYTASNFFLASNLTVRSVTQKALTANTLADVSVENVTLGSSFNNLIVFVWTEGTVAQNVTLDLGKVQLEEGAVATAFERRDITIETLLCMRYYQAYISRGVSGAQRLYGYTTTGNYLIISGVFLVPFWSNPVGTIVGTWTVSNCGQPGVGSTTVNGFEMYTASTTAGGIADCYTSAGVGVTFELEL